MRYAENREGAYGESRPSQRHCERRCGKVQEKVGELTGSKKQQAGKNTR